MITQEELLEIKFINKEWIDDILEITKRNLKEEYNYNVSPTKKGSKIIELEVDSLPSLNENDYESILKKQLKTIDMHVSHALHHAMNEVITSHGEDKSKYDRTMIYECYVTNKTITMKFKY